MKRPFRQAYIIDVPASFHNGSSSMSFADGHAEVHQWKDARTRVRVRYAPPPPNVFPTPNNRDSLWLAQHTSVQLDASQGGEVDDQNTVRIDMDGIQESVDEFTGCEN